MLSQNNEADSNTGHILPWWYLQSEFDASQSPLRQVFVDTLKFFLFWLIDLDEYLKCLNVVFCLMILDNFKFENMNKITLFILTIRFL